MNHKPAYSYLLAAILVSISSLALSQDLSNAPENSVAVPTKEDVEAAGLSGTHWETCAFRYSRTQIGQPDLFIYEKATLDFTGPTTAKMVNHYYARDKECKEVLGEFEAIDLSGGHIDILSPTELDPLTLHLGATHTAGTYELDMIWAYHPQLNSYHMVKITGESFEISDRCYNQEYIDEGLCQTIDGNSPDNRATTFGMFGDDRNIFVKVR